MDSNLNNENGIILKVFLASNKNLLLRMLLNKLICINHKKNVFMGQKKNQYSQLKIEWNKFNKNDENKKVRIRDAAKKLNCSEAELLSLQISKNLNYLEIKDLNVFFKKILTIDKIMLLIRNDFVVHEKNLETKDITFNQNSFLFKENNDIILNFQPESICHIFHESKLHAKRELKSFQFFNSQGDSILKIYLKGKDSLKFSKIAKEYIVDYNYQVQENLDKTMTTPKIEKNLFFQNYDLKNTKTIQKNILRSILEKFAKEKKQISIYAMGTSSIQYHNDFIKNIVEYGPWINVIDKGFNIHVLEKMLNKSKIFEYSYNDQSVYNIEFFDKNKNLLMGITSLKNEIKNFNKLLKNLEII
tara:strand:+ start:459 stop:1535 length:1077 start_codon:yes stop_codon:yes gene_type:complete